MWTLVYVHVVQIHSVQNFVELGEVVAWFHFVVVLGGSYFSIVTLLSYEWRSESHVLLFVVIVAVEVGLSWLNITAAQIIFPWFGSNFILLELSHGRCLLGLALLQSRLVLSSMLDQIRDVLILVQDGLICRFFLDNCTFLAWEIGLSLRLLRFNFHILTLDTSSE